MGDGNFRPPHRIHTPPPNRSPKKLVHVIMSAALRLCQIWCKSAHGGLLGKWVKYNEKKLFIPFFGYSSTGQTRRRIFTLDGSNDADSRKSVPFRGFVDISPHFGGEIPPKNNFGGVNRLF